MPHNSQNGSRGKHGRHAAPEQESSFFSAEKEFPHNPYNSFDLKNDGPVPYTDRKEEVARLRRKKKRHGNRLKIIAAVVLAIVLVFGVSGAAFAMSAMEAKDDAQALVSQGKQLKDQLLGGDMAAAKATSQNMSDTMNKLHDTTSSPLWAAATIIPVVGSDIQTVRIVSDSAQSLVEDVLMPAMDTIPADGLKSLMSENGAINVSLIDDLLTTVSDAAPVISENAAKLDETPEPTIDQLKKPIEQVKSLMSTLAPIADSATELKDTLPAMLGAEGKRNYLIIACTSAEMRSSVGFAGSYGLMTVDNGKISLGDFFGFDQNPRLANSAPSATEEDIRLFRWESSVDSRDVTQIIDFQRVGEIESEIWEANGHGRVDGVIALDTVVLQRMLGLTGTTVNTPGGDSLNKDNASDFLLNGVYKKYPNGKDQDAVFALVADTAAKGIFGNLGKVNIANFAKVISTAIDQGRIAVYMKNDNEEAMLEDLGFTGTVNGDEKVPETGVYMSACFGGKMYYYLASDIQVGKAVKNADGTTTYDMKVTFKDTLDSAEFATLPNYITNGNQAGSLEFLIYLLAPTGGKITDMKTDGTFRGASGFNTAFAIGAGGEATMNETTYQGNDLWYGWAVIEMGDEMVLNYKVTTAPGAEGELVVRTTPLSDDTEIDYQ